MKYLIRLLAALPMMGTAIATMILLVAALDCKLLVIPAILCGMASVSLMSSYEYTVRHLAIFIKIMAEDALAE